MSNVQIIIFPRNTTFKIHPIDVGIIAAFNCRFRNYQLEAKIDKNIQYSTNIYKIDQFTTIIWSKTIWNEMS